MIRNKPEPLGIALGEQLARFADESEHEFRGYLGFVPKRCNSCAYRKGTFPNGCLATVANALKCSMEGDEFYCHETGNGLHGHGESVICAGWILLNNNKIVDVPWDFVEGAPKP